MPLGALGLLLPVPVPVSGPNAGRALVRATGVGGLVVLTGSTTIVTQGALKGLRRRAASRRWWQSTKKAVGCSGSKPMGSIPSARAMARTMTMRRCVRSPAAKARACGGSAHRGLRPGGRCRRPTRQRRHRGPLVHQHASDRGAVRGGVRLRSARRRVLPVYKHFPGHGHARGDSHKGASVTPPLSAMGGDLLPYHHLSLPMV